MDITVAKGICLVIFFVIPVVFGILPLCLVTKCKLNLVKKAAGKGLLCYLNCFAGGVFLGTSLLSLMTEGKEQMEEYAEMVNLTEYPFFEVGIGIGFFLVALIEKLSYRVQAKSGNPHHHGNDDRHNHDNHHDQQDGQSHHHSRQTVQAEELVLKVTVEDDIHHDGKYSEGLGSEGKRLNSGVAAHDDGGKVFTERYTKKDSREMETSLTERPAGTNTVQKRGSALPAAGSTALTTESANSHAPNGVPDGTEPTVELDNEGGVSVSTVRATLLLLALSFHTIFDGLAVGLQTKDAALWSVLAAVVIHKVIVSICLGIELSTAMSNKPLRAMLSLLVYAFMAPVGVAIGMGITSGEVDKLPELLIGGILQAIATGAFLYVTSVEILGHAMATEDGSVLKVFTAVSGFGAMALVKVWD